MGSCSKAKKLTFMTLVTRAFGKPYVFFKCPLVRHGPKENPLNEALVYRIALVTVDEVLGWILGGFLSPISRR